MPAEQGKQWWSSRSREYYSGALMVLIGACAAARGATYGVGTLTDMGSGFFPLSLGVILVILGVLIAGSASQAAARTIVPEAGKLNAPSRPEWRGWICIISSVAAFAILGRWGGMLPATFAITFISAMGDRANSWRAALTLAVIISVICVVLFSWALQVQLPLFAWG